MNPEFPQSPREELELRVTSLLLGELSEAEAVSLRAEIAKDPELQKLHDDLKQTINLVREATVSAGGVAHEESAPLRLSKKRRKKLRIAFLIPPLKPEHVQTKRERLWVVPAAVVATILAVLGMWMFMGSRRERGAYAFRAGVTQKDVMEETPSRRVRQITNQAGKRAGEGDGRVQISGQSGTFTISGGVSDSANLRYQTFESTKSPDAPITLGAGLAGMNETKPATGLSFRTWSESASTRGFYDDNYAANKPASAAPAQNSIAPGYNIVGSLAAEPKLAPPPTEIVLPKSGDRDGDALQVAGTSGVQAGNDFFAGRGQGGGGAGGSAGDFSSVQDKGVKDQWFAGDSITAGPQNLEEDFGRFKNLGKAESGARTFTRHVPNFGAVDSAGNRVHVAGAVVGGASPSHEPAAPPAPLSATSVSGNGDTTVEWKFKTTEELPPTAGRTTDYGLSLNDVAMDRSVSQLGNHPDVALKESAGEKVPVLGDLPVLGRLFRSQATEKPATEQVTIDGKKYEREFVGYDDPGGFVPQAQSASGGSGSAGLPLTAQLPLPHYRLKPVDAPPATTSPAGESELGLNKSGNGTLDLGGANSFNGGTVVNSGTVGLSTPSHQWASYDGVVPKDSESLARGKRSADIVLPSTATSVNTPEQQFYVFEHANSDRLEAKQTSDDLFAKKADVAKPQVRQRDQLEKQIDVARNELGRERDKLKINDSGFGGLEPAGSLDYATVQTINAQVLQDEAQLDRDKKSFQALTNMSRADQLKALPNIASDPQFNELSAQLNLAQQALIKASKDLGPESPAFKSNQKLVEDLSEKVSDRLDGVLVGLKTTVESKRAGIESLRSKLAAAKEADLQVATETRPYYDKKRELDNLVSFQKILERRLAMEKVDVTLPRTGMVTIMNRAVAPAAADTGVLGLIGKALKGDYQATASVKIDRPGADIAEFSSRSASGVYDPYFIQTEYEAMKSEAVLTNVVKALDLQNKWGTNRSGGNPVKTSDALELLRSRIEFKPVKNTMFTEIVGKSSDPKEAAAIANAVAEAYQQHRLAEIKRASEGGVRVLEERFEEQQAKVKRASEELAQLREQLQGSEGSTAQAKNNTLRTPAVPGSPQLNTQIIPLRFVEAEQVVKKLAPYLSPGATITANQSANAIVITETQPNFKQLSKMVDSIDIPPRRNPATNAPIPQPEIQTSENNFSTFSLNVSDVSFKLAAASLEKGQMPDSASIRTEEFINAFDYRDPEAAAGSPVAFAWERARYPFAHNRDLLRFSLKTAAAGRQAGRPLNIVLLLDNSGSMERADRVDIIREALRVLASQLQPQDKLSVITFARTPRLVADGITGDKAGEAAERVSGLTPEGGTNLEDAMNLAYQTAANHYLASGINRVVVLTDGAANLGNVEPESLKQKVEAQRKQGIALDCFGIGWEGFNDDLLEVLSRNGDGRYGFINSPEEAASEFAGQLAGALKVAASDVKVQVEWNPKRVTSYRQIGYAKHQLTKEQFRDNTVDAAEIAAQEAGNALYTVEVNPAGEGPLATVHVRYKIPGTTDYREQAWDVPFNGNAVALEQSSAAMRLATSASAFSEWLAVSPHAGEVTPDALLNYLSGVSEVFGADSRPKKLEWMIRQAKSLEGK